MVQNKRARVQKFFAYTLQLSIRPTAKWRNDQFFRDLDNILKKLLKFSED